MFSWVDLCTWKGQGSEWSHGVDERMMKLRESPTAPKKEGTSVAEKRYLLLRFLDSPGYVHIHTYASKYVQIEVCMYVYEESHHIIIATTNHPSQSWNCTTVGFVHDEEETKEQQPYSNNNNNKIATRWSGFHFVWEALGRACLANFPRSYPLDLLRDVGKFNTIRDRAFFSCRRAFLEDCLCSISWEAIQKQTKKNQQ